MNKAERDLRLAIPLMKKYREVVYAIKEGYITEIACSAKECRGPSTVHWDEVDYRLILHKDKEIASLRDDELDTLKIYHETCYIKERAIKMKAEAKRAK